MTGLIELILALLLASSSILFLVLCGSVPGLVIILIWYWCILVLLQFLGNALFVLAVIVQ